MLLGFTVFQSPCTSHYEFWQEVPLAGAETNNQHTKNMGKNSKNIVTKSVLLSTTAPQFLCRDAKQILHLLPITFSIVIMILLHEDGVFLL